MAASFLSWLEAGALSTWLRESESLWALPGMLFLHTLAMGLLAGACIVLCLRVWGIAAGASMAALRDFLPLIHVALWVSVITGVLLLIAYPVKALTNPVFYIKLAAIAIALACWRGVVRNRYVPGGAASGSNASRVRRLAAWSLLAWFAAIALGRLLAYTYRYMTASEL